MPMSRRFQVTRHGLTLDGEPFQVLSGAMHYFRTLPQQWPDRLAKLRAMGLNTVETYVPWNLHEPRPGEFTFTGLADVEGFLTAAEKAGLYAIVRPGPYICAEWENGGIPAWLEFRQRCHDPRWLEPVDRWFDELIPRIAARQVGRGGNVLMVQVENEYGSYGDDHVYLRHLASGLTRRGIDVPLFTSDGSWGLMVTGGTVPEIYATANFGSDPAGHFAEFARNRDDPEFCMEFWNGWFDHWGEEHHVRDPEEVAKLLDELLTRGASVNVYMAHGGTNFGFMAGANAGGEQADGRYEPTVTSYDYDAPISEHGEPTAKFWAYREVLGRHTALPPEPSREPVATLPAREIACEARLSLLDCLDVLSTGTVRSAVPRTFEELGQAYGLAVYRGHVPGPRPEALPLTVTGLHDRACVLIDGVHRATLERDAVTSLPLATPERGVDVTLIVEAMGRVNYGPVQGESKGVTGGVRHERQSVFGWEIDPVPLDSVEGLPWGRDTSAAGPSFHRATLHVEEVRDGFIALPGWGKGYVWVNGFNLGRYWSRGPQVTLYLPWPLLRRGANELVVLELDEAPAQPRVEIRAAPDLGESRS
ncbi:MULTISPECIES: glycoside hydrolase family 35 protein [Streptosporangium]|uniref:Beta-galactosidase n=1 Tax=Streptosporangium brasiliense TaxID=47480 RepID=A0ABT9RF85_9ACTN|nr:beta-galactosidase family protein [Streptosporangium brasiliense]MDP9867931.1 beta-galactosidase [Streptosporangium brasiliense]